MLKFRQYFLESNSQQIHPQRDDDGKPVVIRNPHTPSSPDAWSKDDIATTTPGHTDMPSSLNGVDFKSHKAPETWSGASGTGKFEEPEFKKQPGYKQSVGIAMIEGDKIWIAHPTNAFGGYHATFPKGTVEPDLSHRENAIKETHEETGLRAELTGHLGDFKKTTSVTRLYTGRRVGGHPSDMGWESQGVSLVPIKDLHKHVTHPADQEAVRLIQEMHRKSKGE